MHQTTPVKTVLVLTVGLILIYYITNWQLAIYLSIVIGVVGLLSESLSNTIHICWLKTTNFFGCIVRNIILSLVYFLLLVPISLLYKVLRKNNPLELENNKKSFFQETQREVREDSFKKMW